MVERLSPLGFARVGVMNKRIRIMSATEVQDPDTGAMVPGPPIVHAELFACIEPAMLSRLLKEELGGGGAILNTESSHITCWYVSGVSVSNYIEYDFVDFPPPGAPMRTRRFDILEVRHVFEDYRLLELLCKERVSQEAAA